MQKLSSLGIGRLFGPGTPTTEAVRYIREWFAEHGRDREAAGA
jgi:methylmalonyl-CoA mutase C-terminal domain/subunit